MDWQQLIRSCVRQMPSYLGPLVSGSQDESLVRLASNENPLGVSEKVTALLQRKLGWIGRYPDDVSAQLRLEIAAQLKVEPEQVLVGSGSNELLGLAGRAFLEAGRSAVYSQYCFAVYPLMVQATGAQPLEAPAGEHFSHDPEAMLSMVRPDTRMLLLANPNNPTGGCLTGEQLRRLLGKLPSDVVVVLDQAYSDYVARDDYLGWHELKDLHPALLMTRSFSKMHALAGLRVGYGIGAVEMIRALDRVRPPFNVGILSQQAALASLRDREHRTRSLEVNRQGMQWLRRQLAQLENPAVELLPSEANFLTLRTPVPADALARQMMAKGVLIRSLASYRMPDYIRVTVGLPEENSRFVAALAETLRANA